MASWIRRDRCHPCVILWSIGNEIPDMHVSERGLFWTEKLMEEVHRHDSWQAPVTFGSNYMPWAGAQNCADVVKIPGYNYAENIMGSIMPCIRTGSSMAVKPGPWYRAAESIIFR